MLHFYWPIIVRAAFDTPAVVSSNWIAVCVTIAIFLATLFLRARRQPIYKEATTISEKVAAVFRQWAQLLREGAALTLFGWLCVFGISVVRTVYADHQQINAEATAYQQAGDAAVRERDALKVDNERLTRASQSRGEMPELKDSLRRRTFAVAKQVADFMAERIANRPPDAFPNSSDPNPTEERKRAIKISQDYARETETQYEERYRDRMIGIVREYESKGVPVRFLINDFQQHAPSPVFIGSIAEGSCMDELHQFKELAYHVDGHDHLITIY